MIIIWGSYAKERQRGFVADRCPVCQRLRIFKVTEHYKVNHIYYIPLGGGKLLGTTKTCVSCGADVPWRPESHPTLVQTIDRSPEELVEITSPFLAETIDAEQRIEERRREAEASEDPEVRWDALRDGAALDLGRLRQEGYDTEDLVVRLKRWSHKSVDERNRLLAEVAEMRELAERISAATGFLKQVTRSIPESAGCFLGCLTWIALATGCLLLVNTLASGWIIALEVLALVLAFAVYMKICSARLRRWIEQTLIPQGRQRGIDFDVLLGILANARRDQKGLDEKMKALLSGFETLLEVFLEQGLLNETEPQ